jgi:hypothetical protein
VQKLEKYFISYVFLLCVIGTVIAFYDKVLFEGFYAREDSVLEWHQFLALAASAGLYFYRFVSLRKDKNIFFLLVLLGLSAVFTFGAGEEISWGQRIFDIKSSTYFIANNSQQETNFHNLILGGVKINKLIFGKLLGIGVAFYMLILPWLYRKKEVVQKTCDRFSVPIPAWYHVAAFVVVFVIVKVTKISGTGKAGEIMEFGSTWIFFLLCWRPLNKNIFLK